jgi:acetyltransferase-like isoleucine patch superfamily enzyme
MSLGDNKQIYSGVAIHSLGSALIGDCTSSIEDNVGTGASAVLLPVITLGLGYVIDARAVVTKDVPSETIVAGIPASVVRLRSQPGT